MENNYMLEDTKVAYILVKNKETIETIRHKAIVEYSQTFTKPVFLAMDINKLSLSKRLLEKARFYYDGKGIYGKLRDSELVAERDRKIIQEYVLSKSRNFLKLYEPVCRKIKCMDIWDQHKKYWK